MKDFALSDIKKMIDDPFIYDPTGFSFLDNRYNEHIARGGNHLYYRLFYHLAKFLQPDFTVELGGWQGTAAAHLARGWTKGTVITIDHHTDPGDEANKVKMLEAEAEYSNIHYIQGWTNDNLAYREKGNHMLGDAPSAMPHVLKYGKSIGIGGIDILFIDSWHMHEEAMMDWKAYEPLLSSPSLVICDDISDPIEMLPFWDELPGEKFLEAAAHPGNPMGFLKYEQIDI